ncbi:MAG: hypothetical protein ACI84K_001728 [Pseudohongiellaceae bacterium]|jgi:hypothetical protein
MAHISTEQALQTPQNLRQQQSNTGAGATSAQNKKHLSDDDVTILRLQTNPNIKKVKVETYKNELGRDNAVVQETLKNKLAEYKLSTNTQLKVEKDMFGNVSVKGALLQSDLERISDDLNNSEAFKESFSRLSQQQPTLNYVDNVVKLSSAYGVGNNLFNSLISEDSDYNKLNDIAHRYDALKNTTEVKSSAITPSPYSDAAHSSDSYHFTLNA